MMYQPFHIVDKSPWPITGSIAAFSLMTGLINLMHFNIINIFLLGLTITILTMIQWWRDVCREATFQGNHTLIVTKNMKWGMILFIISEVFFFVSFFWAFFHSSLSPNVEIGSQWPPMMIIPFNPFSIPLLNTTILLSSGITITWSHHSLIMKNFNETTLALAMTIILGITFTILQSWEYIQAPFSISDSIYGSTFFMSTGFHGLHVIIGTTFLTTILMRVFLNHMSNNHHFGFEAAAWYWHFVDVVWLFLYTFIYWWTF
uniref:cytochrome c oxidase subunit III n=1 Tax=Ornithodoros noorsveldensis TaxID=1580573 RepID=UPI00073949BA|nr:cytochrome c oxidase subunit III [Ornithodoros noorsveldensis]AIZ58703.1 cytochrome c oxidase subunit III [Ornithodoros noorsveldensis]AIZ58716.1 cytochrome c oxidase subunit III [Ornithodoros noorsveldensis]UYB78488.1 cytochrome c oxidase subunit III [Ornithodoros noorsveldensis]